MCQPARAPRNVSTSGLHQGEGAWGRALRSGSPVAGVTPVLSSVAPRAAPPSTLRLLPSASRATVVPSR